MMRKIFLITFVCAICANLIYAQSDIKDWYLRDLQKDSFYGISINKAYSFLENKPSKPIIVAVIDGGIDTTHEDLKNILWRNSKEIPGNGIDDDGNGYVDDVYGWNFLGNKDGRDLKHDLDERTRTYFRYKQQYSGKNINVDSLSADEKWRYITWQKAAAQMKDNTDDQVEVMLLDVTCKAIKKHDKVIRDEMKTDVYTREQLEKFQPETPKGKQAKLGYITCMKMLGMDDTEETNKAVIDELDEYIEGKKIGAVDKNSTPPDYRAEIIGDDYFNINDRYYGNGDVMGPSPMHGTHVSGIIAAEHNSVGMNGIANNVKIMMIRAVPDGDEYDKDIALAIKYAVDNGAKVINMSFGKRFSPEKKWVDEAVAYAEKNDVLLIHASGNESENVDSVDNYPNADLLEFHSNADNFINVGASGDPHLKDGKYIADFSNYGKQTVDVFAPGVKIYSTLPGGNQYGFLSGTSMASPVVAGVAALLRSYYPDLSAKQIKYAIVKSAYHLQGATTVNEPGTNMQVPMSDLCISGGFVDAYDAAKLASTLKPETKKVTDNLPKATFKNNNDKKVN
jgi:subtilisin family serine protease